jgi:protoheme IX farnesyltransferase
MNKTLSSTLSAYYRLTKPGIIRGNLMTAIGGFFLAANGKPDWHAFVSLMIGMICVIGASCVFNNYLDRGIDARMERTKSRATVVGTIPPAHILIFGGLLSAIGCVVLVFGTNLLTTALGVLGLLTYVGVYTPAKHRTPYATLIGTFPGAIPPVAGYTAISNRLDLACVLMFVILVCWQMPHFFAIAIRRLEEYRAAHVPVWPLARSMQNTKQQMLLYALGFVGCVQLLSIAGYTGLTFSTILSLIGAYWCYACYQGLKTNDNQRWAKSIFLLSLPILPVFSLLLAFNYWLI